MHIVRRLCVLAGAALLLAAIAPLRAEEAAAGGDDQYLGWGGTGRLDLKYYGVSGDSPAFEQYHQQNAGLNGGIDAGKFGYKRADGLLLYGTASIDAPNDYRFDTKLEKENAGWAHLKLDYYKTYYDGRFRETAGYPTVGLPVNPVFQAINPGTLEMRTLNLNFEVGLALQNFPKVWLGYERNAKDGDQSTTERGISTDMNAIAGQPETVEWGVAPLADEVDYDFNRIYAGISWDMGEWNFSVLPQYELVRGSKFVDNFFADDNGAFGPPEIVNFRPRKSIYDYDRAVVDVLAKGPLVKDKVDLQVGYHFEGAWNRNNVESRARAGREEAVIEKSQTYIDNTHNSDSYMHRFFMQATWEASTDMSAWLAWQYRNGRQDNDANRNQDGGVPLGGGDETDFNGPGLADEIYVMRTNNEETGFAESIGLELRNIPKSKLVAEGEFEQIDVDADWKSTTFFAAGVPVPAPVPDPVFAPALDPNTGAFHWIDTGHYDKYTAKVHLNSRWCDWLESNLKYRYTFRDTNHDTDLHYAESKVGDPDFLPQAAVNAGWTVWTYPGSIGDTQRSTHNAQLDLKMTPTNWLVVAPRTAFTWTGQETLDQTHDEIAETQSWLWGLNVRLDPVEHLSATTDAYWVDGQTWTRADRFTQSLRKTPWPPNGVNNGFRGSLYDPIWFNWYNVSELVSFQVDNWTFNLYYAFSRQESLWKGYRHYGSLGAVYKINDHYSVDATFGGESYYEHNDGDVNDYDAWLGFLGFTGKY